MTKAVIFDVDGTVANIDHRKHLLTAGPDGGPLWHPFFSVMGDDLPIEAVIWLNRMLALAQKYAAERGEVFAILIVTARPDMLNYRQITIDWLAKHGIEADVIYMRAENDTRQDHLVKQDILSRILSDGYEPMLVIDDRPEVVAMWREFGITTLQCEPDEIPASRLYGGQTLLDVLIGPAGAGKSSYCSANYKPEDIISSDAIRVARYGDLERGQTPEERAWIFRYARNLIKARMDSGVFTVFDATNLKKKDRLAFMSVVPRNILVRYIAIDRNFEDKVETRGWRSEELIADHHEKMKKTMPDVKMGDGLPNVMFIDKRVGRR